MAVNTQTSVSALLGRCFVTFVVNVYRCSSWLRSANGSKDLGNMMKADSGRVDEAPDLQVMMIDIVKQIYTEYIPLKRIHAYDKQEFITSLEFNDKI